MESMQIYVSQIKEGGIVAFPTETVYGLGASATNPSAIAKVFEQKGRPSDNPLIVHISSIDQLSDFTNYPLPKFAPQLMEKFWPGPLTIVIPKKASVLDSITAGLDTVAVRMPNHALALEFIQQTGPLVAPSANKSSRPSPTKASHVLADFGSSFPVIDGGPTEVGLESTVLDLTSEKPTILRPGSISKEEIEECLNSEVLEENQQTDKPKSPGQKYSHYKPNAEVHWLTSEDDIDQDDTLFLLVNSETSEKHIVGYDGDYQKLARELYDRFRQADLHGYNKVIIEPFHKNNSPVAAALLNRIEKAIGK